MRVKTGHSSRTSTKTWCASNQNWPPDSSCPERRSDTVVSRLGVSDARPGAGTLVEGAIASLRGMDGLDECHRRVRRWDGRVIPLPSRTLARRRQRGRLPLAPSVGEVAGPQLPDRRPLARLRRHRAAHSRHRLEPAYWDTRASRPGRQGGRYRYMPDGPRLSFASRRRLVAPEAWHEDRSPCADRLRMRWPRPGLHRPRFDVGAAPVVAALCTLGP